MDRTSAPGHVNHLFVAEDPATNRPPTELVPTDFNAWQEELMAIIEAAEIAPDANNLAQVLAALRSDKLFQTPAQFDATKRVATMEAVQREIGSYAGVVSYATPVALLPAVVGKLVMLTPAAAVYNVVLPPLANIPVGKSITLSNTSGLILPISCDGTEQMIVGGNPLANSLYLASGEYIIATSAAGYWEVHGSGTLRVSNSYKSSLGTSGWKRFPDAASPTGYTIEQWFVIDASSVSSGTTAFPVQFPNAVRNVSLLGNSSPGNPAAPYLTANPSNSSISWDRNCGASCSILARVLGY